MQDSIDIIGAGQAGAQVAQSLRQGGYEGLIRIIGDEPSLPYQRPPLSKKFLLGEMPAESLLLRPEEFYSTQNIDVLLNTTVDKIDREAGELVLADGQRLEYGRLVIATGTRARSVPLPGADLTGVFTLRSIADVDAIRDRLETSENVVIIGAGYIGLEVAAVTKMLGKSVTVVEAQDRPMKRVVSPIISEFYSTLHREKGVELMLETGVEGLVGDDQVTGVKLSTGVEVPADLVLVAVGAVPNTELAEAAGLEVDNGIVVDGAGQTSDERIYAAGDCTRFYSERYHASVRMESVQNAIDQAKAVATSMTGGDVDYDPLPWFWSDQYDIKLQIVGLSDGYDDTRTIGDPAANKFCVAYLKQGTLIAVDSINFPRSHMMARRVVGQAWADDLLPDA